VTYLVISAALLLPAILWFSRFAAAVFISFLIAAIGGSLVSLCVMRDKLVGFTLAVALTATLSFAAYLGLTMIIKGAEITVDELNRLLALFLICLLYAVAATLVAYPLIAALLHRFLAQRFHHLHIPPHHFPDSPHHHH
jgi:tetrahydromethanopterin S-methyltransferase subunit C